ncbi:type II toxin-antitoxin system HicB family antitoxin [Desulfovibrio cuneatus]|uniref:type II toxin-antitoxin system HicB family antitoxin n=1 Tax=Desulfovibrio cuneatus TaxID=159728 RepID=UPI0004287CDC|nr:type II toxin-antitoxin system HicB family antitoxin [Desulfovibrio cuneatus]
MYTYPVTLTRMQDGQYMVEFPDVPQALTYGKTKQAALAAAESALYETLDQ